MIETPHIDALAAQGVKLSHYYVQSVSQAMPRRKWMRWVFLGFLRSSGPVVAGCCGQVCSPTRSVLLTGKYQIHTGLQHSIIQSGQPRALGTEHTTIPEKVGQRQTGSSGWGEEGY